MLDVFEYLNNINPDHWVNYKLLEYGFSSFGNITSNPSEQSNNWLGDNLRSSTIVTILFTFVEKLQKMISQRSSQFSSNNNTLLPIWKERLETMGKTSQAYVVYQVGSSLFNVKYNSPTASNINVVDLEVKTCSCGVWKYIIR